MGTDGERGYLSGFGCGFLVSLSCTLAAVTLAVLHMVALVLDTGRVMHACHERRKSGVVPTVMNIDCLVGSL